MSESARILDPIRRLVRHLRLADRAAQSDLGPMLFEEEERPQGRRARGSDGGEGE